SAAIPLLSARLPRAAGLQARLHVATRLGCDYGALGDAVLLRPDDLQIDRPRIPVLVQDADIADEIDIAAPVGLHLRLARALLASLAVPNVHVPDPGDDSS